jgi:2-phosphosulfolactate phosphatase
VAVIDVLRATSAICTAIHHGAKEIIPVVNIDKAREYLEGDFIVGAERDGEIVEGFKYGNSPYSYAGDHVKGKTIVLSTTNGTFAIAAAQKAHKVVIASFLNLDAVSEWLSVQNRRITLMCAGWKNKFNLEDSLLAGAIADQLIRKMDNSDPSDSALAAQRLYNLGKDDLMGFLEDSSHRRRLKKLFIEKDIEYCLTANLTATIPVLEAGTIVKLAEQP